MGIIPELY